MQLILQIKEKGQLKSLIQKNTRNEKKTMCRTDFQECLEVSSKEGGLQEGNMRVNKMVFTSVCLSSSHCVIIL